MICTICRPSGFKSVDQETRDKKVKELYPEFEKNLKEDMLEYGRTNQKV